MNRAEPRPRARVVRVDLGRLFKEVNRAVERVAAARPQVHHAAREILVSLDRERLVPLDLFDLGSAELQVQPLTQLVNDLVLKVEYLCYLAVDLNGLDDLARADFDEA